MKDSIPPNNPKRSILVAGQVGQDAQHNCSSAALGGWLVQRVLLLKRENPTWADLPVVFRPHPHQATTTLPGGLVHQRQLPKQVPLADALDNAEVVVTYNSTLGIDAMLRGVPVLSHPCAHYHDHAVEDYGTRLKYLSRLAYAQWKLSEFESGEALEFLLRYRP
jgi:capsule polysaccharide export protein KpsC/LpsZ